MADSLGEKLRKAREERDISISEVAEQTRISAIYLEAIENDDYKPLPGGIFNKGFVKSFAKYVGIDEGEALQEYARIAASQEGGAGDPDDNRYKPEVLTDDQSGPSLIPTLIFSVVILGLLAWGVMLLVNYLQDTDPGSVVDNTNTEQNLNSAESTPEATPLPPTDEINLKIATAGEALSVSATVDGQTSSVLIPANSENEFSGKDAVKVVYYKGLASTLTIFLNGTKLETPIPPADYPNNGFEFEINQGNIKGILEEGKITAPGGGDSSGTSTGDNA
ncbi:MAG: helix-turn-helix domain-containing protein [Acidobacteria bacterium]|nr:MAG: helix-turn-helix domain-containing protein [Acidobacteriota bacterium]REK01907.1 MAG: helix-turn-helix domain-containing protein [Acidobacteriota bacterium]REK14863.1 MAG: helix-turn-helix domain-containing protein [Acidobacteriota bacterium]REK45578.1 MAG: helix-turn-helix domain-containing protein [Acidobacteriota bacterium]